MTVMRRGAWKGGGGVTWTHKSIKRACMDGAVFLYHHHLPRRLSLPDLMNLIIYFPY